MIDDGTFHNLPWETQQAIEHLIAAAERSEQRNHLYDIASSLKTIADNLPCQHDWRGPEVMQDPGSSDVTQQVIQTCTKCGVINPIGRKFL